VSLFDFLRHPVRAWRRVSAVGRHGGAILGLCGIVFLWGGILHSLSAEREQALRGATENAENLARAFEEDIIRSIRAVDQTLLYVRDSYEKDPARFDISTWARNTQFLTDLTFQISLIDKSGLLVGSSTAQATARTDLSDREHFRVHRDTQDDALFISKPLLGRTSNKWSIQMTRKMIAPDGSFDGVVVVSLDPQYLSRFYDSVHLGDDGSVTLVGTDGIVRARAASGHTMIGQSLAGGRTMSEYMRANAGTFQTTSLVDGIGRIYAYRGVPSYQLIVLVGIAETEVLAHFESQRLPYLVVATALTALLLGVTAVIMHHEAGLRRTRAELRASEARYAEKSGLLEAAVENMSQGIMMVDANRHIQVCNQRIMQQLDLPPSLTLSGASFDDVLRWQWQRGEFGRDGSEVETWLRDFVLGGGVADTEQSYERTRPNGRVIEVRSTPLPGGGMVRTYTDITDRKKTETTLRAARDEADRNARAKSEFLAMMSHEIRSPMNGLLGIVELLRETTLDPEQTNMAELAHAAASSLLSTLNGVLDFSKVEAGAVEVAPEPVAIRELVRVLVDAVALSAGRKGVRLGTRWDADLPGWIVVDPLRLRQILGNLLSNALKFTPAGSVELAVSRRVSPVGGQLLAFAVSDTGVGMPPAVVERLFEPFMQADASTTKHFGGTGLGLSISRRLARMLGGDIDVSSEPGSGSTFTLTIPLIAVSPADPPSDARITAADDGALRGMRVLLAEDQATNRWLMQRQFARFEVDLELAEDGSQALAAYQRTEFDLLVTDCHMPGMDGTELARCIRALEATAERERMPILGLTADITQETRERCLAAGMDDVVSKPINLRQLEAALRRIMGRHDGTSHPPASAADVLFDISAYRDLFADAPDEGAEWLNGYLDAACLLNGHIRDCILGGDREALMATAHRLAGTSLSAGAVRVGLLARRLESAAPDSTIDSLHDLQGMISAAFDATRAEIGRRVATKAVLAR
jgi:signal transduction histidine kinase/CheY-like chemotaxis protein/HPt (histidine-containing phosphotransfer) domain-containing protein